MKNLLIVPLCIAMHGCVSLGIGDKSDFSCANIPDTELCMPISELDVLSENSDHLITADDVAGVPNQNTNSLPSSSSRTILPTMDSPVAILNGPMLLRTYIGPWRSGKNLFGSSYAYITVKDADFSFGINHEGGSSSAKLFPLQVDQSSPNKKELSDKATDLARNAEPLAREALKITKDVYLPK